MTKVQYYTKNVYGNQLNYLVESPEANAILGILGAKTISEWQMNEFMKLGVEFERVFESRSVKQPAY